MDGHLSMGAAPLVMSDEAGRRHRGTAATLGAGQRGNVNAGRCRRKIVEPA